MKSIFEQTTREEIINRVEALEISNQAQWGKMNVYQMVKHCTLCEDMYLGKIPMKRAFIGRLIGKMFLNKSLKDESPFGKNSPTSNLLIIQENDGDFEGWKKEWIGRIQEYITFKDQNFIHPFFGPMTKEQIGLMVYKHSDHHLRQFGG